MNAEDADHSKTIRVIGGNPRLILFRDESNPLDPVKALENVFGGEPQDHGSTVRASCW
jgi:hypothetical protein